MKKKLLVQAISAYICGAAMVALLLFLPAGTLHYPGAWLLFALLFVPMLLLGIVLYFRSPELLQKRLNRREGEREQRRVIGASALMFLLGFIAAGLDFRFGVSCVPAGLRIAASALFLFSYGLYAEVMRENAYLSRTVEVQRGQKVVDTGLYGVVRHPMYAASILMFLAMPMVLGSWIALAVFLIYPFVIAKRIQNEERVLEAELAGYAEYKKKVKWRLIPFVW